MTVNKRGLVEGVSIKSGLTQADVKRVIEHLLEEIKNLFHKRKKIELRGFGTFFPQFLKSRSYIMPRTGEEKNSKDHWTLKFKASRQLSEFPGETKDQWNDQKRKV